MQYNKHLAAQNLKDIVQRVGESIHEYAKRFKYILNQLSATTKKIPRNLCILRHKEKTYIDPLVNLDINFYRISQVILDFRS